MSGGFYAQLHLHTMESSACGHDSARDMVRACKAAGYSLIVVTDHFFNANINCPRHVRWAEKVECLMSGYRAAKRAGEELGISVLFGWETNTGGPEVLTYGLDEAYLLAHPDIASWDLVRYLNETNAAGAFNVHAHPFRQAYYIEPFEPQPQLFEAFEVFNAHHAVHREWDERAERMAAANHLIMTAGADAHAVDEVGEGAMELPWPVRDMPGLIAALRSGKARIIERL